MAAARWAPFCTMSQKVSPSPAWLTIPMVMRAVPACLPLPPGALLAALPEAPHPARRVPAASKATTVRNVVFRADTGRAMRAQIIVDRLRSPAAGLRLEEF
ncbi:hypothetical protein GCM10010211_53160 [Streptomyces albospinus]|uniref:Uncharacterized protein n=1 Tax=Streptomyces albospinus TaxID=285515 RepID=A0ABQ2VEX9_9ACTN|nr:hypothetical protein GCM10010211_53160 [Streptomyces albospinus]